MSKLNVPIQINGGEGAPQSSLDDRELYISSDGYLYAGKENDDKTKENIKIKSEYADNAGKMMKPYGFVFDSNPENQIEDYIEDGQVYSGNRVVAILGGFHIYSSHSDDLTDNLKEYAGAFHGPESSFNICPDGRICHSILLDTQKITLSPNSYGTKSPEEAIENPSKGQLYFKIVT